MWPSVRSVPGSSGKSPFHVRLSCCGDGWRTTSANLRSVPAPVAREAEAKSLLWGAGLAEKCPESGMRFR